MATSTTLDVEFDGDIKEAGMDSLQFQDIPHDRDDVEKGGKTHEFTNFPHSAADSDDDDADDKDQLLKDEKKSASFWTFAYYQQFFDVETEQVGKRILGSMIPNPAKNYLVKEIRPNPDLYGPFWICTTLVFTTAIAGNMANYFSAAGTHYHWKYDFHKVTIAATAIFCYWWLVPLALFGVLWWRSSQSKFTFLEIICVYGYSLAIYVPISILWAIQVSWLQWLLVVLGASLSGAVLLLTFWPAISEDNKKIAMGLMAFMAIMHFALAAGFVLYFFHVPSPASTPSTPLTPLNSTLATPVKSAAGLPALPGASTGGAGGGKGVKKALLPPRTTGQAAQVPRSKTKQLQQSHSEVPSVASPSGKVAGDVAGSVAKSTSGDKSASSVPDLPALPPPAGR